MNVTGATVMLKGLGSGNLGSSDGGEMEKPLHLFLAANNGKSLEDAKCLAENLMETICGEFVPHSRASSSSLYNVIPSSQSQPAPAQNPGADHRLNANLPVGTALLTPSTAPSTATSLVAYTTQGTTLQSGMISVSPPLNLAGYAPPIVTGKTCYNGYGGIYPQETPLQQVALALRQSSSLIASMSPSMAPAVAQSPNPSSSLLLDKEKRPAQKRKFQELTVTSKMNTEFSQEFELLKPSQHMKKITSNKLPLLLPPPPPPKFAAQLPCVDCKEAVNKEAYENVLPDTLVTLMEYGEEDDYPEENSEESMAPRNTSSCHKPFWAV